MRDHVVRLLMAMAEKLQKSKFAIPAHGRSSDAHKGE